MTTTEIEYPIGSKLILCLGGAIIIVVGLFIMQFAWQFEYIQWIPLLFGLLFSLIGILCYEESTKRICLEKDGISASTIFRKKTLKKETIKGYREVVYSNSKGDIIELVILAKEKQFIRIESRSWGDNYKNLIQAIRLKYDRIEAFETHFLIEKRERLYKMIGILAGIFFMVLGSYQLVIQDILPPEQLSRYTATLAEPTTFSAKRKGLSASTYFQFEEYPNWHFHIYDSHSPSLHSDAKLLQKGDRVTFDVLKIEAAQKIERSIAPKPINKHLNWNVIELYGLQEGNQILLDRKPLNAQINEPMPKIWIILFGLGMLFYFRFFSKGHD